MPKYSSNTSSNLGFIHLVVVIVVLIVGVGVFASSTSNKNVLGEMSESEKKEQEQVKESAKKAEEFQKESTKKEEEIQKEESRSNSGSSGSNVVKTESVSSTGVKSKTQSEGTKSETEIETVDGKKIKTKVEDDGTTKIEIEYGQLKVKYVVENGQIKLKAENEQGKEIDLKEDELNEIENEIEDQFGEDSVKIASGSGKPYLIKNNIAALTDFPLSVDLGTNQLVVTTPAGQKTVAVLPDQAVQNLLATGIINKIVQSTDPDLTPEFGQLGGVIKLEIRNNEVVYRVNGVKQHQLLGFIPISTDKTVFVSADSGETVTQEQSVLSNIVTLLSR